MRSATKFLSSFVFFLTSFIGAANTNLHFYIDKDAKLNPDIPTPESILGYQVGEWHVRHDQLVEYMYTLAKVSDRINVEQIGLTYERRPLLLLTVSSEQNVEQLSSLQNQHLQLSQPINSDTPNVTWMGYSVHGNEASGANASLLLAYYLAASNDEEVLNILQNQIIIIEPAINPDGLARFAQWVNSNKNINQLVSDKNHREHNETWPKGRTNHYWFDLNRDWLLLQHPESRARISKFHQWKPQVLTDFHEMGADSSYFFQPGVPSRQNPLTPDENFSLTAKLAKHHAAQFDQAGQLYYTKEDFDDFYYGKGSTYPDINGAVGILFEQATARGHLMQTYVGVRHFREAVRNQFLASLSTLRGVQENGPALKKYQREFYKKAYQQAKNSKIKAYVIQHDDKEILKQVANILLQHDIKVYQLAKDIEADSEKFSSKHSLLIPTRQRQYPLLTSLFEQRRVFEDNTFYDVSTWHFPSAFDLKWKALDSGDFSSKMLATPLAYPVLTQGNFAAGAKVAYAIDWTNSNAPRATYELLKEGFKVFATTKAIQLPSDNGQLITYHAGTIIIPLGIQNNPVDQLHTLLAKFTIRDGLNIKNINQGLATKGPDLGSRSLRILNLPKPLMIADAHVNGYEAGEVWFHLDQRLHMPLTMIQSNQLKSIDLSAYSHLIMVTGKYKHLSDDIKDKLSLWVKQGGTIVATKTASKWLSDKELVNIDMFEPLTIAENQRLAYHQLADFNSKHIIGGAIFTADLDQSHPLAFGTQNQTFAFFKTNSHTMVNTINPFASVARYSIDPLYSGYASDENIKRIAQTDALIAMRSGKGSFVLFADNPNFRGYWMGTQRIFTNALFFSKLFNNPAKPR